MVRINPFTNKIDYGVQGAALSDIAGLTGTKGDLIVHDGSNWVDVAVGANDTVLTADSTQSSGVKWASAGASRLVAGYVENLGIDYNAGTGVFTIQGGDATLSASNPGYVCLASKADPGELTLYEITADQSFIDDVGASEIIGNLFGLTTGVAHAAQLPFYIYAVGDDTETSIAFMISRVPNAQESPAAASIGDPGDPVADTQGSFFSLETITEADYESNPCTCIGSFKMVMSASDDWTVIALNSQDGMGKYQEGVVFAMSPGQFGAASGTYILANGGTAPVFSSGGVLYTISKDGQASVNYTITGDGGTDGAGAVAAYGVLPYREIAQISASYAGGGQVVASALDVQALFAMDDNQRFAMSYNNTATTNTFLLNSSFGNGSKSILASLIYNIRVEE